MGLKEQYETQEAGQDQVQDPSLEGELSLRDQYEAQEAEVPLSEQYAQQERDAKADEIEYTSLDAIGDLYGDLSASSVDKVARFVSGTSSILKSTTVDLSNSLSYWVQSKFMDDDELDSPEERQALMLAIQYSHHGHMDMRHGLQQIDEIIQSGLEPYIDKHGGKDFVDLAEESNYIEAADAFVGDVASALPSVAAAFAGPGGLAVIGGSAFGSKFVEDLEESEELDDGSKWADLEDRLFLNSASAAGGEILSEMFTAGLGGGVAKMAKKFGPKVAKTVMEKAGAKLAFSFTGEGLSEVAADAWSRLGDYAIVGDMNAFQGAAREFGKTFLIGGAIGGGIGLSQLGDKSGPIVKDIVTNKVRPQKIKEADKAASGRINALTQSLNHAKEINQPETVLQAIRDQIKTERDAQIKAQKRVEKQLDKASPDDILKMDEIDNKINDIRRALEDPGLDPAAEETLLNKLDRLQEEQDGIFLNPQTTDAAKKEPVRKSNKKISKKVQELYETKPPGYEALIAEQMSGQATNIATQKYFKVDPSKRKLPVEDFISKLKFGKGGVLDLIKTYDPAKNVPLAAYVNSNLKKRADRIIKEVTHQSSQKSLDGLQTEGKEGYFASDVGKASPREIVDRLSLPQEVLDLAGKAVERLELLVDRVKNLKDYGKTQKQFFKDRLAPALKKKVKNPENYRKFLRGQPEMLNDLYVQSTDFSKIRTGPQAGWGTVQPNQKEFVEYFEGRDLDLSTKKGKNALNSRKDKLIEAVADQIGTKAWQDYVDRTPEAAKTVSEIKAQKIKKAAQVVIPNSGMNKVFQESQDISEDDFAGQSRATNKVLVDKGLDKAPNAANSSEAAAQRNWTETVMTQWFPRSFFTSGNFWNAGVSASERAFFYETQAQFDEATADTDFSNEGSDVFSKVQRYSYKKKAIDKMIGDKALIKERGKANQAAFNQMWKTFDAMIKDDPANAPYIAAFLKSAQNSQNHLSRLGAPLVAYSKTGPYTEEHAMPQAAVSRYLLQTILDGGSIDESLANTNKNFVQVALNHQDDLNLKKNKIGPNGRGLNSDMPLGWVPTDNWLARYFNSTSDLDPDSIVFFESGLTIGQTYVDNAINALRKDADKAISDAKQGKLPTGNFADFIDASYEFADYFHDKGILEENYENQDQYQKDLDAAFVEYMAKFANENIDTYLEEIAVPPQAHKQIVVDQVVDQTPKQIDGALSDAFLVQEFTPSDPEAAAAMTDILAQTWGNVESKYQGLGAIVDKARMVEMLEQGGHGTYPIDSVYGLNFGGYIYVNTDITTPETPIHEFGHVWNGIIRQENPELFNAMYDKLQLEAPNTFVDIVKGMEDAGYELDPDSDLFKDEVMAQAIGKHGANMFKSPEAQKTWTEYVKQYWDTIKNALGFDPSTKSLADLNVKEMLDLIVDEVVTAQPGKNINQLKKDSPVIKRMVASKAPAAHMAKDPNFKALQKVKETYKYTKDMDLALNEGFKTLGPNADLDTWLDYAKNAIKEVDSNIELSVAKSEVNDSYVKDPAIPQDPEIESFNSELSTMKPPRKPNSFFLTPKAEDFEGLLYTLLPSGKAGVAMKEKFQKHLVDPYNQGITNLYEKHNKVLGAWKAGTKGINFNEKIAGTDYTIGDAIKVASMIKNGIDPGIKGEDLQTLQAYSDAKLASANELFDVLDIEITPEDLSDRSPLGERINSQIVKKLRSGQLQTFNNNLKALGLDPNDTNSPVWRNLEKELGKDYTDAFKGMLKRMKTGKNRLSTTPQNPILKWLGVATSTTMFWNRRSAVLQMLSAFNYMGLPNNNVFQAAGAAANAPQFISDIKTLWNSQYLQDRRGGAKFDVLADEIAGEKGESWMSRSINKIFSGKFGGFAPTRLVDSFAIASGGAAFYRNTIKALKKQYPEMTDAQAEKLAYEQWTQQSEKTQQSSDPSKVSAIQADELGKIFFAFANTPFQYARYAKRRIQDVASGRSKNPRKDIQTAFYYTAGQTALFTGLQTGLIALAMSDDDDDAMDDKALLTLERSITGLIKPLGYGGAASAATLQALAEMYKQHELGYRMDDARIAEAFLGISPVLSTKFRGAKQVAKKYRKGDDVGAAAEAGQFATGLPFAKLINDVTNVREALEIENDAMEKWARLLGWSKWDFVNFGPDNSMQGRMKRKRKELKEKIADSPAGKARARQLEKVNKLREKQGLSPIKSGETGQAFKDGTIEVDPNLSPEEKHKTIQHEKKHVQDMKDHGLDYDDDNVYWEGKKFPRKAGMISIDGGFKKEGDPSLPWEESAYEAETPLKANGGGKKKKTIEEHDKEADEFTTNWYNDKNTRSRLKDQTGLSDEEIDQRIAAATNTDTSYNAFLEAGDAEYNSPGRGFDEQGNYSVIPEGEPGHYPGNIQVAVDLNNPGSQGILPHEQTHALEFDNKLGLKAQEILGPASEDEYLNNPGETYGNLQEFRSILKLEPWERDLTPERLQNLIEFQEVGKNEDVQQMLRNYDIKKLTKALNKIAQKDREVENKGIAYDKPKKKLSDLYI